METIIYFHSHQQEKTQLLRKHVNKLYLFKFRSANHSSTLNNNFKKQCKLAKGNLPHRKALQNLELYESPPPTIAWEKACDSSTSCLFYIATYNLILKLFCLYRSAEIKQIMGVIEVSGAREWGAKNQVLLIFFGTEVLEQRVKPGEY